MKQVFLLYLKEKAIGYASLFHKITRAHSFVLFDTRILGVRHPPADADAQPELQHLQAARFSGWYRSG